MHSIFSLDHHLPDNFLSSPKVACKYTSPFSTDTTVENGNVAAFSLPSSTNLMASSLLPTTSALEIASLKTCYFQGPRYLLLHVYACFIIVFRKAALHFVCRYMLIFVVKMNQKIYYVLLVHLLLFTLFKN